LWYSTHSLHRDGIVGPLSVRCPFKARVVSSNAGVKAGVTGVKAGVRVWVRCPSARTVSSNARVKARVRVRVRCPSEA